MPPPRRVSEGQLEELVAWMESHPLMATATHLGGQQSKLPASQLLWEELASRLNSVGDGVSKTHQEWRRYWSDQKFKLRKKVSQLLKHAHGTDGGPALVILNPIEGRISNLIGIQNKIGNENIKIELDVGLDPPPPSPPPPPPPVFVTLGPVLSPTPSPHLMSTPSTSKEELITTPGASETSPSSTPHPPKRTHIRQSMGVINSPTKKSRPLVSLPRCTLDLEERRVRDKEKRRRLEERRVALEELRLKEERNFRRSILTLEEQRSVDQRNFQQGLLSLLGHLLETLAPLPSPTSE